MCVSECMCVRAHCMHVCMYVPSVTLICVGAVKGLVTNVIFTCGSCIVAAPIKLHHGIFLAGDVTPIIKIMEGTVNVVLTHLFCLRIARTKH